MTFAPIVRDITLSSRPDEVIVTVVPPLSIAIERSVLPDRVIIRWDASQSGTYTIWKSAALKGSEIVGQGIGSTWTETFPPGIKRRFYRVSLQPL